MAEKSTKITELIVADTIVQNDLFLLTTTDDSKKLTYDTLSAKINSDVTLVINDNFRKHELSIDCLSTQISALNQSIYKDDKEHDGLSARIYENELSVENIDSIIGTTEIAGTITENIDSLRTFSVTKPTDSTFGPIKIGYASSGNNYSISVDANGCAFAIVPGGGGGGGGKPEGYDELTAQVRQNTLSILNISNDLSVISNDFYVVSNDLYIVSNDLSAFSDKISSDISSISSDIEKLSSAIYGTDEISNVIYGINKCVHSLIERLYDAEWRQIRTNIDLHEFNNILAEKGFKLDDPSFTVISCRCTSITKSSTTKTLAKWQFETDDKKAYDILFNIPRLVKYPTDYYDFVVGDILVYKRKTNEEETPTSWIWEQDASSLISTYNNNGEIKKLSASLNSGVIYTNTILSSTNNTTIINLSSVVDYPNNSFIRLKIYKSGNASETVRINEKDFTLNPDTHYYYTDYFNTVEETPTIKIDNMPKDFQICIVVYKNFYP